MKFTFAQAEEGFDNHIERSIRGYNDLCSDIISYSSYFVEDDTTVIDIGCSSGKLIKRMNEVNKDILCNYIGIECEEDFIEQFKQNNDEFDNIRLINDRIENFDMSSLGSISLVTSIFTLQFITKKNRLDIIKKIYDCLQTGGSFIFAEKTISEDSRINEYRTFVHYDFKRKSFEYDEIMTKEKKLRFMMKPNTRSEIYDMCLEAGFKSIDSFWQNHAFTGFIAIK